MIPLSQLANTNFLLLYFLIFLPPSTLLIIIFFYLASLLTLVSLVLHFLSSHLIFSIALSLFPFNLTSLLQLPSPLASLRVQSLVLFSSVYILPNRVTTGGHGGGQLPPHTKRLFLPPDGALCT